MSLNAETKMTMTKSTLHAVGSRNCMENTTCAMPLEFNGYLSTPVEIYSPRRLTGFGTVDGEATERLWSYLRSFAAITKEMTPSHRIDMLSDALLHYGQCKKAALGRISSRLRFLMSLPHIHLTY